MSQLTIHTVVKNEPFVGYAIRSVYPYAETILLTDNGSTDEMVLAEIGKLVQEDTAQKIRFDSCPDLNVGVIRQRQMEQTTTPFLMLVDGDEVHYREGMRRIVEEILPAWPADKLVCYIPADWYTHPAQLNTYYRHNGRVIANRPDLICVRGRFPDEFHYHRGTGRRLRRHTEYAFQVEIPPYAHFSVMLKPRRHGDRNHPRRVRRPLPEVILEDPAIWERVTRAL